MISHQEENSIIDRVLAGEKEAYARLVDEYKSFAFTIAMKITGERADAEEAAQDAFVRAYSYLKGFNRQSRFSTWLYRIVFNTAVSYKRKKKPMLSTLEFHDTAAAEDNALEKGDKSRYLAQAMGQLNEADRMAIQLYYIKEFSLEEVAGMMGHNLNTLKVRIHRARQRLANELSRLLKEEALSL